MVYDIAKVCGKQAFRDYVYGDEETFRQYACDRKAYEEEQNILKTKNTE